MSWQAYIDSTLLGSGVVSEALIAGQDGATWAKSPGLSITDDEVKQTVAGFKDPSGLYANGLRAGGAKYTVVRGTDENIHGKKGASGIIAVKTGMAVIFATYSEDIKPENTNNVIESLADYLKTNGM